MADPFDELYAAPLRDFIKRRAAIAARLREQGKTSQARALASIAKPKATVWAVNRAARTSPKAVQALVAAFDRLKAAQLRRPAGVAEASAAFRTAVERVTHEAIESLKRSDLGVTLDTHRRIAETLRGAAATSRRALLEGTLTAEQTPVGFDVFGDAAPSGRPRLRLVSGRRSPSVRRR